MRKQETRAGTLARGIVDQLFVNGQGQQASRLVLTVDKPLRLDLGGLSRANVCDIIERALVRGGVE